jgi:Ras-related protein Rab-6A
VAHNSTTCRLQLWDTAGQERYRSLIPSYLKDAVCAVFVCDLARNFFLSLGEDTLAHVQSWIDLFRDNRSEKAVMVICGNKVDLLRYYYLHAVNVVLR